MSHHLVGLAEVAELLGVSKQRVGQLIDAYADFPRPEIELAAGRVWTRASIQAWVAAHPERSTGRPAYDKLSPFEAVQWPEAEVCEVRVGGRWYELKSIDGVAFDAIVAFAVDRYGDRWQKRIDEDLVEVLGRMGQPAGSTVSLRLRSADDGKERVLDAKLSSANRQAIYRARNAEAIRLLRRVERNRPQATDAADMRSEMEKLLVNARAVVADVESLLRRLGGQA